MKIFEHHIYLFSVSDPPEITVNENLGIILIPNARFSITCHYIAIPMPSVQWFHNGTVLDIAADPRVAVSLSGNSSVLRIENVTSNDAGLYHCSFRNNRGNSSRQVTTLHVLSKIQYSGYGIVTVSVCRWLKSYTN